MIGKVLKNRYEVLEKIGDGNLFTVYKCDDKIDNRPVAVKVLLAQYAANRMFAERIIVEAQAMVGISHPGIAEVYDSGEENGEYYVVTEYIRGVDLKERIRRSAPFSLPTVVEVGTAICDVLDFAHRKGFIHGDLQPRNILVTPEGQIKLTDFWVSNAIASSQAIRTNAMMRSVHYMAPEVAEGKPATPAADIYSLGIIMFELITGNLPFDGDTPIAIALKHGREPVPSLRALNPAIPKVLETAVAKALQKSPEDRFRSAKAMLSELKSVDDALHLSKPLVWSQPTGKAPSAEGEVEGTEPAFLSALRRTLIAVVALFSVLVVIAVILFLKGPTDVRVPNLVGKTFEEAEEIAAKKDLELVIRFEHFNEKYPTGTICYTLPATGRIIKSGKTIGVWISKGSEFAAVPDVANLTLEEAKQKITDADLNTGEVSQEYSDKVPAGSVISQTPAAGTRQERSQPVNLVFSLGPELDESSLTTNDYDLSNETRSLDVKFTMPPGPEDQTVKIVVLDEYGENIAYTDVAHPGDRIVKTVQGVGNKITIRIYIDDKLVREERKWR